MINKYIMHLWLISPNVPETWSQNLIKIIDGKRNIEEFIEDSLRKNVINKIEFNNNEEFVLLINEKLNLNEHNVVNTLTIFEDKNYIIQFCYQQDYIEHYKPSTAQESRKVYNYFASMISNDIENIFGNVLFFKIKKNEKKLVNLTSEELLNLLANLYYVKTFQVLNNELVEIAILNNQGYINDAFKDRKKIERMGWEFYLGNNNLEDIGLEPAKINDYNNLIILKKKSTHEISDNLIKENNINPNELRGVYQDLSLEYVEKLFIR